MAQIQVRDQKGNPLPRINVRVSTGTQSSEQAIFDVFTDLAGNTGWPIPFWPDADYTLWVNDRNVDPKFGGASVFVPKGMGSDIQVVLEPVSSSQSLPKLVGIDKSKHRFIARDGSRPFLKGVTMFLLYKHYLDGKDIKPVLEQLRDLGFNMIRLFGMVTSFADWHPQEYGDRYYQEIANFCKLCESYGIYVLWTACADTGEIMPNEDQATTHIVKTLDELNKVNNAIFSFVNEQGQHENGINREKAYQAVIGKVGDTQFDTGSFGGDIPCEPPFGTYAPFHVRRDYPQHIKDCCIMDHPNYVQDGLEVLLDEPDRFGEGGNMSLEQARDSAGTSYTSLGYVFHTSQGVQSQTFSGRTLEMAKEVIRVTAGF